MKVYVVTSGEYSEYHIVGITLDKQATETFVNGKNATRGKYGSEFYLEEYETDDFQIIKEGCKPYKACFYGNENGDRWCWATERELSYQATNWLYTGKTAERTDIYSDGHSRHYEKQEKRRITRTGKHRYVYLVGNKKERKEMMRELRYEVFKEYPKGDSKHYDTKNPKMVKPIKIIGEKDDS